MVIFMSLHIWDAPPFSRLGLIIKKTLKNIKQFKAHLILYCYGSITLGVDKKAG